MTRRRSGQLTTYFSLRLREKILQGIKKHFATNFADGSLVYLETFFAFFQLTKASTIGDIKHSIGSQRQKYQDVNRQELRLEPKGKGLKNEDTLKESEVNHQAVLYFKDRGLQIGWTTVFLTEYAGPLLVYLWVYTRPWLFYGDAGADKTYKPVVQ